MNTRNLYAILALIIGIPVAIFIGISVAQDQTETILWIGGIGFFILCFALGRHVWILIPATLGMKGYLNCVPGTPAPWHLMTAVVLGFTILRLATRRQKFNFRWTGMETAVLLVALSIFQAFLRNPIGFALLGGSVAGGKTYIIFGIGIVAFLLIGSADANLRSWRWAVIAFIGVTLVDGCIGLGSALSPKFAGLMIRYYSNVSFAAAHDLSYFADITETRIAEFGRIGSVLGMIACCFWRPISAIDPRKPWRGLTAATAVILILLSGFRSAAARLFVNFSIGSLLRRKPLDVFVVSVLGVFMLGIVYATVPTQSLPYSFQRVFGGIGFNVRADVAADAESSSSLRFEMWKLAMSSDRYISNKLLGDGFQFSTSELAARQARMFGDYQMSGNMSTEEALMATGSYHGFHVETIRFTGIVGLVAATVALIVFAVFSWRCIQRFRDDRYWGYVLYVCMPFLIYPLWFWLVFGGYRAYFGGLIAMVGMIKLLDMIWMKSASFGTESALKETGGERPVMQSEHSVR